MFFHRSISRTADHAKSIDKFLFSVIIKSPKKNIYVVHKMKRSNFLHYSYILIITIIFLITACGDKSMSTSDQTLQSKAIPAKEWERLSAKKIYFGHMSVGYNIIDGIKDLMKSNPSIRLNLQETADPGNLKNGVFVHSQNGENGKPKTKVDAFVKTMDNGPAKQVDIAFFKFCYVDFNKDTDAADLFNYYASAMDALEKRHPKIIFLHVTVPVTTEGELLGLKTKIKDLIKSIIGRETARQQNITGNMKRNEFSVLLRKKYDSRRIIDIEKFESTKADGSTNTGNNDGGIRSMMVPEYTFDGGHLNEKGRIWVADKVLARLTELQQ